MNKRGISIVAIMLLCIISYANTFINDFVWDENVFVTGNIEIRDISNIPKFFFESEFGLYRPLRTTLYSITYSIWEDNLFGYHLNSLFWHSLISMLIFLIIQRLSGNGLISFASAAIFASTPIHIERVTNMTGGFDLMGIFFLLLAFYYYISKKKFVFTVTFFILALFSSEEAIIFPLLVLLYELVFNGYKFKEKQKNQNIALLAAILVLFIIFRVFILGIGARALQYPTGSFLTTILTMPKVFFYYLLLILFPFKLNLYREISASTPVDPMLYISILTLAFLFFLAVKFRHNKLFAFSIFWFFITLLPFTNIIPLQALMADRYLYMPSLAAALVYSLGISKLYEKNKILSSASFLVIVLVFTGLTIKGNTEWKDEITLWSITAERSPNTSAVFSNLGFAYDNVGLTKKARENFEKAIYLDNKNPKAHYNLGTVYFKEENYTATIEQFNTTLALDPYSFKAYNAMGLAYYYIALDKNETFSKAFFYMNKSIAVNSGFSKGYSDLGMLYGQMGEFEIAIAYFETAIKLDVKNDEAYFNLGILYEFLGDESARKYFLKAYELKPENEKYAGKAS